MNLGTIHSLDEANPIELVLPLSFAVVGGLIAFAGVLYGPIGFGAYLLGLGILVLAGASVVIRMRRATGDTRLQLKWVTYAVAVSVAANVAMFGLSLIFARFMDRNPWIPTLVTVLSFGVALPASFGFAILRYRLYDIDLIVNRTVVYGAVTVILATVFFV